MTDNQALKIIFMGTPDFSVPALRALVECSDHEVVAVYSQPPRPSGRGHKLTKSPVHLYAEEQNIPVYTPLSLKKEPEQNVFAELNADVAVVAAYGLILPQVVLDAPKYGCLNIHASLLPRWRGASPIQRAIWAGDKKSGVTIMQMEAGLDTGPMIAKEEIEIHDAMTSQDLHDSLSEMGGAMIVTVLNELAKEGHIHAELQNDDLTTYAKMLKKEDGQIDWSSSAQEIHRQIRALNPWPGTYAPYDDKMIKIVSAALSSENHNAETGTILNKKGDIACGQGTILTLKTVKPQNAKAMDFTSALNGHHLCVGDKFL